MVTNNQYILFSIIPINQDQVHYEQLFHNHFHNLFHFSFQEFMFEKVSFMLILCSYSFFKVIWLSKMKIIWKKIITYSWVLHPNQCQIHNQTHAHHLHFILIILLTKFSNYERGLDVLNIRFTVLNNYIGLLLNPRDA